MVKNYLHSLSLVKVYDTSSDNIIIIDMNYTRVKILVRNL